MQKGVHAKFVDMSTSVREAAVELIGRFVLNKPELIHQYYDMIIERILVSSLLLILTLFTFGLTQVNYLHRINILSRRHDENQGNIN